MTSDKLLDEIIEIAKKYKKKYKRPLGITGEIGERIIERIFDLDPADHLTKGYDALSKKSQKKIQIKSRVGLKDSSRIGKISNNNYDVVVVASFSEDYELLDVHIVEKSELNKEFRKYSTRAKKMKKEEGKNARNPSYGTIKRIGKSLKQGKTWKKI